MIEKIEQNEQGQLFKPEAVNGNFAGKDFISVEQITGKEDLDFILYHADLMEKSVLKEEVRNDLAGKCIVLLFYQESSRTFSSMLNAAQRVGFSYIVPLHGMHVFSSAVKGESLPDTIRTFVQSTAANMIVLRHQDDDSSEIAAKYSDAPIINAGSGTKEHPTQALLDVYTIQKELGDLDGLTVTMAGDLLNGRTIKSLSRLLAVAGSDIKINFVSPEILRMPYEIIYKLRSSGVKVVETDIKNLDQAIAESNVVYMSRVQREWFIKRAIEYIRSMFGDRISDISQDLINALAKEIGNADYLSATRGYVLDSEMLSHAKNKMIVMHPFPRVNEISMDIDDDPRSAYFRQIRYGLYVRMALMLALMGKI